MQRKVKLAGEKGKKEDTALQTTQKSPDSAEKLNQIEGLLRKRMADNEYAGLLGLEILELRHEYARGRIPYKKELLNPYGFLHGGCLYSLADIIAGNAACMGGRFVTTVSGSMNYLEPAIGTSWVYCEARLLRSGRHLAVFEVKVLDEKDNLLDSGEFTYFYSGEEILP